MVREGKNGEKTNRHYLDQLTGVKVHQAKSHAQHVPLIGQIQ